jgi:capsular polysaccharide biosynthesis protein
MIVFFRTLKKYWLIVIASTLLFSGAGFYLNYVVFDNVYQSTASFYVLWEDPEKNMNLYSTMLTSEMIANDIREYLSSQKIAQVASAAMNTAYPDISMNTLDEMAQTLSATVQTNTRIVTLSMNGGNPAYVASFLNEMVDAAAAEFDQLYKSRVIHKMTSATANQTPISPLRLRDTVLFGGGGIAAGLIIILLIMYIRRQLELET